MKLCREVWFRTLWLLEIILYQIWYIVFLILHCVRWDQEWVPKSTSISRQIIILWDPGQLLVSRRKYHVFSIYGEYQTCWLKEWSCLKIRHTCSYITEIVKRLNDCSHQSFSEVEALHMWQDFIYFFTELMRSFLLPSQKKESMIYVLCIPCTVIVA